MNNKQIARCDSNTAHLSPRIQQSTLIPAMVITFALASLAFGADIEEVAMQPQAIDSDKMILTSGTTPATELKAHDIVARAIDHWRGLSSYSEMTMTINRPDWQRSVSMKGWTEGSEKTLIRITAPKKDVGNGTLLKGNAMWSFAPKINRVVKIPSSMMGQSWMGSDFSNNDVARSDDIVDQYSHRLLGKEQSEGHTVYIVEAIPFEDSAVVWGREVLRVRDDYVLLQHQFYDQDDLLVKQLHTLDIKTMDRRAVAARQRMKKLDTEDEWTEIIIHHADFDVDISPHQFTLSNLRNPRP